jgi:sulfur carrier protein
MLYNCCMKIQLNGHDFEVPTGTTIAGLVKLRDIQTPAYAVERNREVVFRKEHEKTALTEGDKVEIVVAVGGG